MRSFLHRLRSARLFLASVALSMVCLGFGQAGFGQTLIAGWDFQTTANGGTATAAATSTPKSYVANVGTGTLYLDGTNGSSNWLQSNELSAFGGTALNAGGATGLSTVTSGASSLALLGGLNGTAANGKFLVYKFSMTGFTNLVVSYATQKTATGFGTQIWEYSTNGTSWTTAQTLTTIPTSYAIQTLTTITGLNNAATAYLRFSGTGASAAAGNNRLDNIQLNATPASTFAVTYNGNSNTGGSVPVDATSPYSAGTTVTVKANTGSLVRTNYTFTGWNTAADGSGTPYAATGSVTFTMPSSAVTLYAQWAINTYTVTYNDNGSTSGTTPVDGLSPYNHGSNVIILGQGSLVKTGFTFGGWNTVAGGGGAAYAAGATLSNITANTILYAQWIPANSYTVSYDANTGSGTAPVDGLSPYSGGSNVTVLGQGALLKTGYTFNGWNTAAGGGGTAYSPGATISNISASVILYAQWVINTYTVTYNGNTNSGGTAPVDGLSPYNYNSNVTVLSQGSLVKTNYNFTGWNTAADGSGTPYLAGGTISNIAANTILYAQWAIITYTVTYNGNTSTGGTAPVDGLSPYAIGSNVTVLPVGTLVKTGYSFINWNTAADGSGTSYSSGATISNISANVVLYAQWAINNYTVTYDGNGNTGGTAPVDGLSPYNFGSTVTVLANTGNLVKTGATFAGWNTAANGSGTSYAATGSATFTLGGANVVLYARWATPLYESFTYTSGDNIGGNTTASGTINNNWTTHSNNMAGTIGVTTGSLSYTGLQASAGNKIRLPGANATVPRDVNRAVNVSGSVGYYSFLLNVADNSQLGTGGDYFTGFGGTAGTSVTVLFGRLNIKSVNTGANYRLAISNSTGGTPTFTDFATDLSFGSTYLVVIKYDLNGASNDIATLWVNPSSLGGSEAPGGVSNSSGTTGQTTFASVFLRNTANTPKADIDEIRVGASWAEVTPAGTYQLTTTAGTGGTVTVPATSPTTVGQGAATTITALANSGFAFSGWTVEAGTASIANAALASTTVTLNSADATVKANFVTTGFTITASALTSGGSISPSGAVPVNSGANQSFTITTDVCNEIADVIVDGTTSVLGDLVNNTYTFSNVSTNHTIDVYFNASTSTTWTGAVSTAWNDVANWSGCLPNGTLDVVISAPGGTVLFQPVLNIDADVNGLTINNGATLSLNGKTLTVNGGFTSSAAANLLGSDASNLVLNSTVTLISSGAVRLNHLTVNAGTTTLSSAVEISGGAVSVTPGEVSVQAGSLLESNGFLTIKSNSFGTGRVAAGDVAGNYITGEVTVERYIPANSFRSWRLLSVPTFGSSQTFKQSWQENNVPLGNINPNFGAQITGIGSLSAAQAAGFDNTAQSASLLSWSGAAWATVPNTNAAVIDTKKGYFLYIRGERTQGVTNSSSSPTATTLRTKGQLYQGTQSIPSFPANGFNLVGNLYASAIDFTQLPRTGGVSNLFYIWDSKKLSGSSLGAYQTFSATNSFNCLIGGGSYVFGQPNTKIESGQAFFVQTVAAGTITLTESSKITNSGNLGFRPVTPVNELVKIDSRLYAAGSNEIADANVVVFNDVYSNAVAGEDAAKFTNPAENFGIQHAGQTLVVEGRHTIVASDNIQFNMWNLKQQEYKLEIVPQNMVTPGLTAMLEDKYLRTSMAVDLSATNNVNFTVDANEASKAADRFRIVFAKVKPVVITKQGYSIAPNPVENGNVNILFSNKAAGRYNVRIVNSAGQLITAKIITHAGGSNNQQIVLPQGIKGGIYQVEIIAPNHTTSTESLLVR